MKKEVKKSTSKNNKKKRLYKRNLIKVTNIGTVLIVRYSGPSPKWTRGQLRQMNQRASKLMTMQKALHPRYDRQTIGLMKRRLSSQQRWVCVDTTVQGHNKYSKRNRKKTNYRSQWGQNLNKNETEKKNNWIDTLCDKLGNCTQEDLYIGKKEKPQGRNGSLLIATQNSIRINYIKVEIDNTRWNSKFMFNIIFFPFIEMLFARNEKALNIRCRIFSYSYMCCKNLRSV